MNLVIAIMGDTLSDMSGQMVEVDSRAKLAVCLDYMYTQAGIIRFFRSFCNKKNKTFRTLFDRSKFLFVIFADETPAIKEQKDSDEKGAKADGIAGPAVSQVFQEKNDGRKINQIAQATTRITQEQISKMRERLEKTLASVILKSHDSLENIQEERFKRVEETNAELKRSQERLENFLQHLEDKILQLEVIQQQTLEHATKAATAANALDKLPQRFSEKMHEPELGSSRSPNKKKASSRAEKEF